MDTIQALEFKVGLNKFLKRYLKNHSRVTVWDNYFSDLVTYQQFSVFLRTRIGQIWLKSDNGRRYLEWQGE